MNQPNIECDSPKDRNGTVLEKGDYVGFHSIDDIGRINHFAKILYAEDPWALEQWTLVVEVRLMNGQRQVSRVKPHEVEKLSDEQAMIHVLEK